MNTFLRSGGQIYPLRRYSPVALALVFMASFACCQRSEAYSGPSGGVVVPPRPDTPRISIRLLALGDSYTIGQGVSTPDRFPHQTRVVLGGLGQPMQEPQYIATTGWTTENLLYGISSQNPTPGYDIVTLLIGVNNQYQRRDTGEYRQQFTQCLQKAIALSGGRKKRVLVLSIPDYSVTPFAQVLDRNRIARDIDVFNGINRQVCDSAGIAWLDVTAISRQAAIDPTLLAPDGLHPSGLMYKMWADKLAPLIVAALR